MLVGSSTCIVCVCRSSNARGFLDMLKEVNDIAGQHEVIAENFSAGLVKQLQTLIHELKTDRKRVGKVLSTHHELSVTVLVPGIN